MSKDYEHFCTRTEESTVEDLLKIWTIFNNKILTDGETDVWAQMKQVLSSELYADKPPTSE